MRRSGSASTPVGQQEGERRTHHQGHQHADDADTQCRPPRAPGGAHVHVQAGLQQQKQDAEPGNHFQHAALHPRWAETACGAVPETPGPAGSGRAARRPGSRRRSAPARSGAATRRRRAPAPATRTPAPGISAGCARSSKLSWCATGAIQPTAAGLPPRGPPNPGRRCSRSLGWPSAFPRRHPPAAPCPPARRSRRRRRPCSRWWPG